MAYATDQPEVLQTCAVRLSADILSRVDAYRAVLQDRNPGLRVDRSAALRSLVLAALATVEDQSQDLRPNGRTTDRTTRQAPRKRTAAAKG
jgi:hypothetical protein